jgi:hypothetical protein
LKERPETVEERQRPNRLVERKGWKRERESREKKKGKE